MAKRKTNRRANNLKRNAAIRSAQVRRERAVRDYSTGRLPKQITETFLGKLSAQQLEQVARRIGREFGEQQQALKARDNEPYQVVPDVHITKLDRELAARPLITDAEIAAAPVKRRKTLRQQQRRRLHGRGARYIYLARLFKRAGFQHHGLGLALGREPPPAPGGPVGHYVYRGMPDPIGALVCRAAAVHCHY